MMRSLAARLPESVRLELKRLNHLRQLRRGRFVSPEPEFRQLERWVRSGDWVLDVGANVGHYTARLSELVGADGRVIAFEPIPETFAVLAAIAAACPGSNVSLINAAASDRTGTVAMSVPEFAEGTRNFYQASIRSDGAGRRIATLAVDGLGLPRVSLAKIDVEGHEGAVLRGMEALLRRDRPTLIVEGDAGESESLLEELGYAAERTPGSPNVVYHA
jgi:FkbM family methyltransferase